MSTVDTSTWNPDADLNVEIEGIPLNSDAGIAQTWQALRILMAAHKQDEAAVMTGATANSAGTSGLVPAPQAGDQNKALKGDGTWGTVAAASHTHGNITNDGKVGTTSGKPLVTGTGGAVQAGSFGTSAGTFCEGNDSRLSNARTPTSHTHGASDISSGTIDAARLPISSGTGWLRLPGNIQICWGEESISGNPSAVTYAKAFSSRPATTVTPWHTERYANAYSFTATGFNCRIKDTSDTVITSTATTIFYIAIGTYSTS